MNDAFRDHDPSETMDTTAARPSAAQRARTFMIQGRQRLQFTRTLGRGGEGVVRAAVQTSIGREVAVKSPHLDKDGMVSGVLQEAWAAGVLEHPNIVPIHDIVVEDGLPHVVMKRIDGRPWERLIRNARGLEEMLGESDLQRWNLEVLFQVCHAVEYAHEHGILHRDLKPANVMIGRFGEVWLVDWGLAVRLGEEPVRLPAARDVDAVVGTPRFMAPEMANGDGPNLGTATDVYLLGGILHLILLGRPPHEGSTVMEVIASCVEPVTLPDDVALRDLLASALSLWPEERPTAAAFRKALQAHLARRTAGGLLEKASTALESLKERATDGEAARAEVYDLYGACRFGFGEALAIDPDLALAASRSAFATRAMIEYELDAGDDRAAELLLTHLPAADPRLSERIEAVRTERLGRLERLEELEAAEDPRTGLKSRMLLLTSLGTVWVASPGLTVALGFDQGFAREIGISVAVSLFTLVVLVVLRRSLAASRLNRTLLFIVVLAPNLAAVLNLGGWLWGFSSDITGTLEIFLNLVLAIMAAGLVEWRLFPAVGVFLLTFLAAMWMQGEHTILLLNIGNAALVLNGLVVWTPSALRSLRASA